jgi:F-type H+-transporting ATPase subunit a
MAPFIFFVELVSHCVRPFSLGLRLQYNMMGDHILLGVFLYLLPYVVPVLLLFLGLFVCFMQAFIFMMLGMIYISMAISHDH